MSLNTTPVFISIPKVQWTMVSASNATPSVNFNGTGVLGTDIQTVFSASVSGSRVDSITIMPLGTNVQTVLTLFVNNGADNTVSTNNASFYKVTMPSTAISNNASLDRIEVQFPNGLNLPPIYRILVSLGTTVATGFDVTAYGGDF
ncbi:MAG: hypothetical protein WC306_03285 [Candidatus Paceibacterota bacterium]|jgi:hypothetical protein